MKTDNLDRAYKEIATLLDVEVKSNIKTGPTSAYLTGNLYNSVKSSVKSFKDGEEIVIGMNYYWQYVNNGTSRIQPPRRFIEQSLKDTDTKIEDILGEASVEDILDAIDEFLD